MILYRQAKRLVVEKDGQFFPLQQHSLDQLFAKPDLYGYLEMVIGTNGAVPAPDPQKLGAEGLLAPIGEQEVWAAGVTYFRSRAARMEESKESGGGSFYDRVYTAERPELFFKAMPHKVVGHGATVRIRKDATWSVPEPELALCVSPEGRIVGYTVGNDMSSRDIEGQNLLYLPQAKIWDGSCALGPGILLTPDPLRVTTRIQIVIERGGESVFSGETTLKEMKRRPEELVEYLFRDQTFPHGCFLLTGTGIVPPDDFTLNSGDGIAITIDGIGTLRNEVA
ncbi:MAG TPA: fumarylacetoacetate hydrolase family protein [Terracidiphilus sp.]